MGSMVLGFGVRNLGNYFCSDDFLNLIGKYLSSQKQNTQWTAQLTGKSLIFCGYLGTFAGFVVFINRGSQMAISGF